MTFRNILPDLVMDGNADAMSAFSRIDEQMNEIYE